MNRRQSERWRPHRLAVWYVVLMVVYFVVGEILGATVSEDVAGLLTLPFFALLLPSAIPVAPVAFFASWTIDSNVVIPLALTLAVLGNALLVDVIAKRFERRALARGA